MPTTLEQQFAQIRENRSEFDRSELPDAPKLPLDENFDSKDLLELATSFWQRIYNKDEFLQVLRKYVHYTNEQKQMATPEKQYFKKLRKAGLIYKSAFRFGDVRRNLPDDMDQFLVKLGELGDHFYHQSGQQVAYDLLGFVQEIDFTNPVDELELSSNSEVETRIEWIVQKCMKFLAEKKPKY